MKRLFVSIAVVFKKQDGCVYCRHVASFLKTHRRTTMYLDKQEKGQNPNTWKISKTWGEGGGCGGACSYCFNFTLTFLIFTSILYTRKKYGGLLGNPNFIPKFKTPPPTLMLRTWYSIVNVVVLNTHNKQ